MDLKIIKPVTGYDQFKVGDIVTDAELLMGKNLAHYLVETEHAEPVKGKTETATAKGKVETADAK